MTAGSAPEATLRMELEELGLWERVVDEAQPILEVSLPFHRVRAPVILPPISVAPTLALRIPPRRLPTLDDLEARRVLEEAVLRGETLLVAGAVSTGKTVLASAFLSYLVTARPEERLVILEEGAREIQRPAGCDALPLLTPSEAEIPMTRLLKASLRLLPDRIVVGELRGPETLAFLKASLSGHPGLATVHATSAVDAVARLTDLLEEAGAPPSPARVARSVRLVVHMRQICEKKNCDSLTCAYRSFPLQLTLPSTAGPSAASPAIPVGQNPRRSILWYQARRTGSL